MVAETLIGPSTFPKTLGTSGGDMNHIEKAGRRSYCAPDLIFQGKLETITLGDAASSGCYFNKIGSTADDASLYISTLHGAEICD